MALVLPPPLAAQPDPGLWLALETPGRVLVRTGKVELGQGVLTALSQLVADGLGVEAGQVDMLSASTERWPNEGFTIGSTSVQQSGPVMSMVGSILRCRLLRAAAGALDAEPATLEVRRGEVLRGGRESGWSYWRAGSSLLTEPFGPDDQLAPPVVNGSVGTSVPRTDLRAKFAGGAFIQDMELPGMQHGVVLRQPVRGARITAFDEARFARQAPAARWVRRNDFIACVAASERQARAALETLRACVAWELPPIEEVGADMAAWLVRQPAVDSVPLPPVPIPAETPPERVFQETWTRPFIAHASIGLSCALAWVDGPALRVWSHSQGIFGLRDMIARVLGREVDSVQVGHVAGAGCYGHNGADDVALDAALLADAFPGQPVRVQWSRGEELSEAPLGAPMAVTIQAALDAEGRIAAWNTHIRSTSHQMRPGVAGTPNLLAAAALDSRWQAPRDTDVPEERGGGATRSARLVYDIGGQGLSHSLVTSHVRTSALRALGTFANIFAIEGTMDELAQRVGCDPADFRRRHLADPRGSAVLERVLALSGWQGPGPAGEGQARGIGLGRYKSTGAWCAIVADVALDAQVEVRRIWCAVDGGFIVNPDGARNQVEGGILQTISWTTMEAVRFDGARPCAVGWESYPILRFGDVPPIETVFVGQEHDSLGLGEVAQGPTVAAIANAVSRAMDRRITDLPISRERLIELLSE